MKRFVLPLMAATALIASNEVLVSSADIPDNPNTRPVKRRDKLSGSKPVAGGGARERERWMRRQSPPTTDGGK